MSMSSFMRVYLFNRTPARGNRRRPCATVSTPARPRRWRCRTCAPALRPARSEMVVASSVVSSLATSASTSRWVSASRCCSTSMLSSARVDVLRFAAPAAGGTRRRADAPDVRGGDGLAAQQGAEDRAADGHRVSASSAARAGLSRARAVPRRGGPGPAAAVALPASACAVRPPPHRASRAPRASGARGSRLRSRRASRPP